MAWWLVYRVVHAGDEEADIRTVSRKGAESRDEVAVLFPFNSGVN